MDDYLDYELEEFIDRQNPLDYIDEIVEEFISNPSYMIHSIDEYVKSTGSSFSTPDVISIWVEAILSDVDGVKKQIEEYSKYVPIVVEYIDSDWVEDVYLEIQDIVEDIYTKKFFEKVESDAEDRAVDNYLIMKAFMDGEIY